MSNDLSVYTVESPEGQSWTLITRYGRTGAVSLTVNGEKAGTAGGGGYDKRGTVIGNWFAALPEAQSALAKLTPESVTEWNLRTGPRGGALPPVFVRTTYAPRDGHRVPDNYGLARYEFYGTEDTTTPTRLEFRMNGACGVESMRAIIEHAGFRFTQVV